MKTKINKILCCALAAVCCIGAFGCTNDEPTSSSTDSAQAPQNEEKTYGTHIDNSVLTSSYFMQNGACEYKILLPANYTSVEYFAADEFVSFFKEATGISLPIVCDNQITSMDEGKYISLGKTTFTQAKGYSVTNEYGNGGFVLKTDGDDIYVLSYKEKGTLNGVYELLEKMLDYDYIYLDTYALNKGVKNIPLYQYDVCEIPDIQYNDVNNKWMRDDPVATRRYRMMDEDLRITTGHNAYSFISPDVYLDEENEPENYHPKWFESEKNPKQLCFTAHGDEAEKELMVEAALKYLKSQFIKYPEQIQVIFGNIDNGDSCECTACMAEYEKYGTHAGAHLKWINRLRQKTDEWLATEEGKPYARDYVITMYAYLAYADAPAKKVGDEYVAIDEEVKPIDGVEVRMAYLGANYTVPFTDEKNASVYEDIQKWKAVSKQLSFYLYYANYHYGLAPYNKFDALQENYKIAKETGADWYIYLLAQQTQSGCSTAHGTLFTYLSSKLGWDVTANVDELTEKFFNYYFEDASEMMYKQFLEYRSWTVHLQNDFGRSGYSGVYSDPLNESFWPQSLLKRWLGYYEEGLKAIAPMKSSNPERYAELYDHITCERLSLWYLYLNIYEDVIPPAELLATRKEFKEDFTRIGLSKYRYDESPATIWAQWGI